MGSVLPIISLEPAAGAHPRRPRPFQLAKSVTCSALRRPYWLGKSPGLSGRLISRPIERAPIERGRRTDLGFGSGQPTDALMVIEFSRDGAIVGGLKFATQPSGAGFDILDVVDGACQPITTYEKAPAPLSPGTRRTILTR
ncbi:MAG: hypothetical protein WD906_00070 [Anaerolineales bacterium]